MKRIVQPVAMSTPVANYAHAIHVSGASEWLFTCGVVPTRADGSVPDSIEGQADVVWENIALLLDDAGMTMGDVVSVTTYVVADADMAGRLPVVMAARDRAMAGHRAASTLVTVPALAQPAWLMEIAVVAAK